MFHVKHSRSCANALRKEERAESRRKSPTREPTGRERAEDEAGRFIPGTNVSRETLFCAIGRVKASREGRTTQERAREHAPRAHVEHAHGKRAPRREMCREDAKRSDAWSQRKNPAGRNGAGIRRGSKQGKRETPESGTNVSRETFSILRERAPQEGARWKPAEGDRARMHNGRTRKTHRRRNVPAGLRAKRGRTPSARPSVGDRTSSTGPSVGNGTPRRDCAPEGTGRPRRDHPSGTERPPAGSSVGSETSQRGCSPRGAERPRWVARRRRNPAAS